MYNFWLLFFFFNDTSTTEIYTSLHTLSHHDALPIKTLRKTGREAARETAGTHGDGRLSRPDRLAALGGGCAGGLGTCAQGQLGPAGPSGTDRKSTRLNSSH